MEQILAHLVGDYILQSHTMANKKLNSFSWAMFHGLMYSLPFVLITQSPLALFTIWVTHAVIDRWRIANYVAKIKNNIWNTPNGYPAETPPWLSVWLMIITDNTMHILINYFAIKYL
jgi:hypothetical protein